VGEHRHFKFAVHVDHRKSQPTENKLCLNGAWSHHVTYFKLLVSLKYLWNGLSQRLWILYTDMPCQVLSFGFTVPYVVMVMVTWPL